MNGVRRLLGAASSSSPQQNTDPPTFSPSTAPSWPPQSPVAYQPPPAPSTPVSPTATRASFRKSGNTDLSWKRSSGNLDTRDELLISLMASEAVIDSRQYTILAAEEVDELKKEHVVLSSRLEAMSKKLARETKIRDAALSLSRVNAAHKKVSRQTTEQLDAANARVDAATRDLASVSDRAADVHRRLMEHRAAVLSFSVRNLEKKIAPPSDDSGYDSSNRSTLLSPPMSAVGALGSPAARFDGAHLFAGHADALVPKRQLSADAAAAELAAVEEKLKEAKNALADAGKKHADMVRELSLLQLEKQEVETLMGMDLQAAEDTIAALERELPRLEELDAEVKSLRDARAEWDAERSALRAQVDSAQALQTRLRDLETQNGEAVGGAERALADLRQTSARELAAKDQEIAELHATLDSARAEWERERQDMEDEKMDDLARLHDELDRVREEDAQAREAAQAELETGLAALQTLVSAHGIVLFSRDTSLQGLLGAVGTHLETVHGRLDAHDRTAAEWDAARRKLEDDVRAGLDKREALIRELEDARRERDTLALEGRGGTPSQLRALASTEDGAAAPDAARIIAVLQPLWAILPSPEARAAKFGGSSTRSFRAGSPTPSSPAPSSPGPGGSVVASLSDLDVRSLKTLYTGKDASPVSPRSLAGAGVSTAPFSVEAFAQRVQALVADDRALIERLLRFAQAHDLLKKNAERAQKLAQDGTHALETYQKQVRVLEERGGAAAARAAAMQEELALLHETLERHTGERRDLERRAAEQAEECSRLQDANNTLSARALALAEEAAQAPERVRRTLEAQLAETRKALDLAQDEVDAMRSSEQSQRIALLDELNSMQTENATLRAQLRAAKK